MDLHYELIKNNNFNSIYAPICVINRNTKLRDSGQSNLTKRRLQNGHFGKRVTSPKARSPRVTLHSSKKPSKSTAQNNSYSEDGAIA